VASVTKVAAAGAFDSAAVTTHAAVNVPAGTADGDLLLLFAMTENSAHAAPFPTNTLTGWTRLDFVQYSTYDQFEVWYRVASSEPASYTMTSDVTGKDVFVMVAFRGADTTNLFGGNHSGAPAGSASTAHTTPSVTPAAVTDLIIAAFTDRSTTSASKNADWTPSAPLVEDADQNNNTNASSAWYSVEVCDDQADVGSVSAQTRTSTSQISQANAATWIGSLQAGGAGTQFARPDADITDGAWLNQAGTNVNLYQSLDETTADDTDAIESSDSPATTDLAEIDLGNITP